VGEVTVVVVRGEEVRAGVTLEVRAEAPMGAKGKVVRVARVVLQ
jgi:hypothetical protein